MNPMQAPNTGPGRNLQPPPEPGESKPAFKFYAADGPYGERLFCQVCAKNIERKRKDNLDVWLRNIRHFEKLHKRTCKL